MIKESEHKKLLFFTPALVWGFFITYYTLIPSKSLPRSLIQVNDKVLHAGIYFFCAGLIYLGFIRYNFSNKINRAQLWFIVMLCTLYGGFIEIGQSFFVASRHGEWLDFFANSIGAIVCVLFLHFFQRSRA